MTQRRIPLLSLAALACCMAACAPRIATISGAEIATPRASARPATLRVTGPASDQPQMELRLADGAVYAGQLSPAAAPPGIGGPQSLAEPTPGALLVGQLVAPQRPPLDCRLAVLNPARNIDGGGTGLCRGADGRQVDFVF